ncbi:MAG: hypothetical protein MJZ45_01445 [Bacteroidales bacterium]|nr:hypothetical protein [Bacteroidales bacterium]
MHQHLNLRSAALVLSLFAALILGSTAQAQVTIPGTKVMFFFPSKWSYLSTENVDKNTQAYLYYYSEKPVVVDGDTTLPSLRIIVRKSYKASVFDYVFDRYSKSPYQSLEDYTQGIGLPASGGMGYVGAYTNLTDQKDYQFRMVYFKVQNTVVEFRLESVREVFEMMDEEFVAILNSLTF